MSLGREDRIHQWLRRRLRRRGFDRVGDDGAILSAGGPWAITQDQQIEGVHFTARLDLALVARRLLAVNLSDLAAMGAEPAYAFLALSAPPEADLRRFLSAFTDACARFGVELAGGDLAANDRVTSSLTLMGRRPAGGRWLERRHGQPGDTLWVAGELGLSALGRRLIEAGADLRGNRVVLPTAPRLDGAESSLARRAVRQHLVPTPQLHVGQWLGRRRRVAAIDVSDGLALDLHRLCRESGVGARIDAARLRVQGAFARLCSKLSVDPLAMILGGGEDYALLFAASPRVEPLTAHKCRLVGRLHSGAGVELNRDGESEPLAAAGWDHFDPTDTRPSPA